MMNPETVPLRPMVASGLRGVQYKSKRLLPLQLVSSKTGKERQQRGRIQESITHYVDRAASRKGAHPVASPRFHPARREALASKWDVRNLTCDPQERPELSDSLPAPRRYHTR